MSRYLCRSMVCLILILLLLGSPVSRCAERVSPVPTMRDLAGAWIGSSDGTAYFRLRLDRSGQGLLVVQEFSPDGPIGYYKIEKTTLTDTKIKFTVVPLKSGNYVVTLEGKVDYGVMMLVRNRIANGKQWAENLRLEPEDYVLSRIHTVQAASRQYTEK